MIVAEPVGTDLATRVHAHEGGVNKGELLAFVERVERVESKIKSLNGDKSDIYKEAKSAGYDVRVLKDVVKYRATPPDKRDERDTLLGIYLAAIGEV